MGNRPTRVADSSIESAIKRLSEASAAYQKKDYRKAVSLSRQSLGLLAVQHSGPSGSDDKKERSHTGSSADHYSLILLKARANLLHGEAMVQVTTLSSGCCSEPMGDANEAKEFWSRAKRLGYAREHKVVLKHPVHAFPTPPAFDQLPKNTTELAKLFQHSDKNSSLHKESRKLIIAVLSQFRNKVKAPEHVKAICALGRIVRDKDIINMILTQIVGGYEGLRDNPINHLWLFDALSDIVMNAVPQPRDEEEKKSSQGDILITKTTMHVLVKVVDERIAALDLEDEEETYPLLFSLSRLLDAMVCIGIKKFSYEKIIGIENRLKNIAAHHDLRIASLARYCLQALTRIP